MIKLLKNRIYFEVHWYSSVSLLIKLKCTFSWFFSPPSGQRRHNQKWMCGFWWFDKRIRGQIGRFHRTSCRLTSGNFFTLMWISSICPILMPFIWFYLINIIFKKRSGAETVLVIGAPKGVTGNTSEFRLKYSVLYMENGSEGTKTVVSVSAVSENQVSNLI